MLFFSLVVLSCYLLSFHIWNVILNAYIELCIKIFVCILSKTWYESSGKLQWALTLTMGNSTIIKEKKHNIRGLIRIFMWFGYDLNYEIWTGVRRTFRLDFVSFMTFFFVFFFNLIFFWTCCILPLFIFIIRRHTNIFSENLRCFFFKLKNNSDIKEFHC